MRRLVSILASSRRCVPRCPLWLGDPYLLHVLITTGIFTIAAMSLNLLLGYTGQLSLGHVAFFGIGAYVSALTSLGFDVELFGPWPCRARALAGRLPASCSRSRSRACAAISIGKLSFKVRGAYFVIVTISFAEVVRLVALNWVELTQGPLALNNIPPFTLGSAGSGRVTPAAKAGNYYLVLGRRGGRLRRHQAPGAARASAARWSR